MALQGGLGDWGSYVAIERGYFEEEGIEVQFNTFQNAGDITAALVSGQGDIATSSLPPVISAALEGAPVKLIGATQTIMPGGDFNNWWATLPGSDITEVGDLGGKKVNIFQPNSLAQAVTRKVLAAAGIETGDFEEVAIAFPQSYTALESGQVDVSLFIEPFFSNSNQLSSDAHGGPLQVVFTMLDGFPGGLNVTGLMANTNFASANPDAMRAFLRAYLKAAAWGNANPEELKEIMAEYTGVPLENIAAMTPSTHSEDGQFLSGFLDDLQQLIIENNLIDGLTEPLPEDRFVDLSYLPD